MTDILAGMSADKDLLAFFLAMWNRLRAVYSWFRE